MVSGKKYYSNFKLITVLLGDSYNFLFTFSMNNNRKLSMSIMLENRKISTDISIPKTSPSIWIPSKNISKCFKCKSSFSIINRKHHCRMCGRIFCYSCADEWGLIPSLINITSPPEKKFFNVLFTIQ